MSLKIIVTSPPKQMNSIQDVFAFRKYITNLEEFKNTMILMPHISDTIHKSINEVINNLKDEITEKKSILIEIEKKYGCSECGAMDNEDCRTSSEIGYCVSFEDFKEEYP